MLVVLRHPAPGGFSRVFTNPCVEGGEGSRTGPGAADVIAQLEGLGHLDVSDPQPAVVGGSMGHQVDVSVSDGALAPCGGLVGAEVPLFAAGEEVWSASPGERFRLVAVDVGDQPLTMVLSTDWTQSHSVQELEDLLELGQRILANVEL